MILYVSNFLSGVRGDISTKGNINDVGFLHSSAHQTLNNQMSCDPSKHIQSC